MYLVGGGIEVDLPVAYQQLIEQIFLTAAGLERVGAFRRVRDTVDLDAQGQNVKNIAAGGFDLALSPGVRMASCAMQLLRRRSLLQIA